MYTWYQIGQGSPPQQEKENSVSETTRKATENHLALFFPRRDMDIAILLKDNGVNEAVSQVELAELRSAHGAQYLKITRSTPVKWTQHEQNAIALKKRHGRQHFIGVGLRHFTWILNLQDYRDHILASFD